MQVDDLISDCLTLEGVEDTQASVQIVIHAREVEKVRKGGIKRDKAGLSAIFNAFI